MRLPILNIELLGCPAPNSLEGRVQVILRDLDGLLASTVLGLAALLPGPVGVSAAAGAMVFDLSRRYWIGALLSGLSMIPLVGYAPAAAKVAWNVGRVNGQLGKIEVLLPSIAQSPALLAEVQRVVGKYADRLVRFPPAASISRRAQRIMKMPTVSSMQGAVR
jgi:hypothetical protein